MYHNPRKQLDDVEIQRLRALVAQRPDLSDMPEAGGDYPRMVYHEKFVQAQQDWKDATDPNVQKVAAQRMKLATHTVFDSEEEMEFLADGWRLSPADFMAHDPRIPMGREARKAGKAQEQSKDDRILALRRQLAALTGEVPTEGAPVIVEAPARGRKRVSAKEASAEA